MPSHGNLSFIEDVILEILARLPVKSLLKFTSVCKEWRALIQSPAFVAKHFKNERNPTKLMVQYYPPESKITTFVQFPDADLSGTPPDHENLGVEIHVAPCDVLGPLSGLFLVLTEAGDRVNHCVTLWNPATREWRPLPTPEPSLPSDYFSRSRTFGFGIDQVNNDYKIIYFRTFLSDNIDFPYIEIVPAVYTFESDSWRYFDFPATYDFTVENSWSNTYVKGVYYWACVGFHFEQFFILSFDMGTEAFCTMPLPKDHKAGSSLLGLCCDMLAIFIIDYDIDLRECQSHVWLMKDNGCWTKLLTLGPIAGSFGHQMFWSRNEIVYEEHHTRRLILYNIDTGETKDLGIQGTPGDGLFYTFLYRESLFSAKVKGASYAQCLCWNCNE